jgi:putative Mn2+ efflux pump MntP
MGYHTFGAILPVIANIGIVAFTLTLLAFMLGLRLGTRLKYINLELIGGFILIGLGIKILFN